MFVLVDLYLVLKVRSRAWSRDRQLPDCRFELQGYSFDVLHSSHFVPRCDGILLYSSGLSGVLHCAIVMVSPSPRCTVPSMTGLEPLASELHPHIGAGVLRRHRSLA